MSEPLLRQIKRWQRAIAIHLTHRYAVSLPQLNHSTQNFILSVLGLRLCEQYGLISPGQVDRLRHTADLHPRLHELVQTVNGLYGDLLPPPGAIELAIADEVLYPILTSFEKSWTAIGLEILGQSYEGCLSQFETIHPQVTSKTLTQKIGGSYYTPRAIVDDIIHQTLGQLPASSSPTILDPACGGGAFLLAAYQYLLQREMALSKKQLTYEQRQSLLLSCIFGVDIDPQAIAVTRLSLQLQLLMGEAQPAGAPLPDLSQTLHCGNALIDFDWKQAFSEIAPAAKGFEVVLGNPPYLDSEGMSASLPDWRRYCTAHYQTAVGNWDLFCVFIEKGLELCRAEGLLSFVVPNKLTSADYAAQTRSLLTCDNQLLAIHDYSNISVFSVSVYPLVFVVRKSRVSHEALASAAIQYQVMEQTGNRFIVKRSHSLPYALYAHSPDKPWVTPTSHHSGDWLAGNWLAKLQTGFLCLSEIAQVTGAATVAEAYAMRSLLQEKLVPELGDLPMVNSGTIDRYRLLWGEKPLRYLGVSYWHPVVVRSHISELPQSRWQQAIQPKIIVASMTKGLECALDATGGILAGKSTSIIRSSQCSTVRSTIDLRYLLAVLNSSLMQLYFVSYFGGNSLQGGYLRVGPPQLRQLPIALPNLEQAGDRHLYHHLITLVDQCLVDQRLMGFPQRGNSFASPFTELPSIEAINQQIDQTVYRLYGLTERAIAEVEAWKNEKKQRGKEKG